MKTLKTYLSIGLVLSAFVTVMFWWPKAVKALTIDLEHPNAVFDDFTNFTYRTPWYPGDPLYSEGEPIWWTIANNGFFERLYNVPCSSAETECVTHETEGYNGFMQLTVKPFDPEQFFGYHDAALTSVNHGYSWGEEYRWKPEPGKPVIMNARIRWSDVYNADGSGDFVGSSGLYLWNMPVDYVGGQFNESNAIGISLLSDDSDLSFVGLSVEVIQQQYPFQADDNMILYHENLHDVDINNWVNFSMIWSENHQGVQKVRYWVNSRYVGAYTLPEAFPALEIESWNDNYVVQDGTLGYGFIPTEQNFDIDYISVVQPGTLH